MKVFFSLCLLLLLCCTVYGQSLPEIDELKETDTYKSSSLAADISDEVVQILFSDAFLIGVRGEQVFFNVERNEDFPDGEKARIFTTDGGTLKPFLMYSSEENYFYNLPLGAGSILFGYNYSFEYASFRTDQSYRSANWIKDEIGSKVEGDYKYASAQLFVRIGPLFSSTEEIFWRAGLGLGAGFIRFKGKVLYRGTNYWAIDELDYSNSDPLLEVPGVWEFTWGDWSLLFQVHTLEGNTGKQKFHLGHGSMNFAYRFEF